MVPVVTLIEKKNGAGRQARGEGEQRARRWAHRGKRRVGVCSGWCSGVVAPAPARRVRLTRDWCTCACWLACARLGVTRSVGTWRETFDALRSELCIKLCN